MKLAPYPKYKPSGVEWLGDVPAHWEVKRIKSIATYRVSNVDKVAVDDEVQIRLVNYTDVYHHDYIGPDMGLMETTATLEEVGRFSLRPGDVVITKDSEDWRDIAVPALVVESGPDLVCGYHLGILRPKKPNLLGSFLFRALQTSTVNQQFRVAATGVTRYGLPKSETEVAWLPLPSPQEQRLIADFLDREAAKIDTLIDKKQTLIERLKEKRAALITRTVTRGLPPDAARAAGLESEPKMRASGIEWLGDVPAHWGVLPLRRWYRVINGGTPSSTEETYWHGGINWITPEDLGKNRSKRIGNSQRTLSIEGLMNCGAQLVPVNSITLSTRAPVGHLAITSRESCTNQGCRTLVPKGSCAHPDYLYYVLLAFRPLLEAAGKGTTFMELSANLLGSHIVPFPPDSEQRAIADFLDRETTKIDGLVAKVDTAIARLREYRAALITAAVTGQVDVRGGRSLSLSKGRGRVWR